MPGLKARELSFDLRATLGWISKTSNVSRLVATPKTNVNTDYLATFKILWTSCGASKVLDFYGKLQVFINTTIIFIYTKYNESLRSVPSPDLIMHSYLSPWRSWPPSWQATPLFLCLSAFAHQHPRILSKIQIGASFPVPHSRYGWRPLRALVPLPDPDIERQIIT